MWYGSVPLFARHKTTWLTTWRSQVLQHAAASACSTNRPPPLAERFTRHPEPSVYPGHIARGERRGARGRSQSPVVPERLRRRSSARSSVCGSITTSAPVGSRRICSGFHQVKGIRSTVHRILTRRGLRRLPARKNIVPTGALAAVRQANSLVSDCRWTSRVLGRIAGDAPLARTTPVLNSSVNWRRGRRFAVSGIGLDIVSPIGKMSTESDQAQTQCPGTNCLACATTRHASAPREDPPGRQRNRKRLLACAEVLSQRRLLTSRREAIAGHHRHPHHVSSRRTDRA